MSNLLLFLTATLAGFIVAVPIGAIGAMCLRRALHGRWLVGLITGFGAALADALLAMAAMFGLTMLTRYILDHQWPIRVVGGLFLICIGVRMILKRRPQLESDDEDGDRQPSPWRVWAAAATTGFALTIINPATLLAFVGVFAGLGLFHNELKSLLQSWMVVAGVLTGSMLWWGVLTGTAHLVRCHLSLELIVALNVGLGLVVLGFGAASLLSAFGVSW